MSDKKGGGTDGTKSGETLKQQRLKIKKTIKKKEWKAPP